VRSSTARRRMALEVVELDGKIVLVSLSGDAGRAEEALRAAGRPGDVEAVRLSEFTSAPGRLLRRRTFQLAIAGAPPADEIGYGLAPLIALAMRARQILLIDLRTGSVRSLPLSRYLAGALPFGCAQLVASAVGIGAQRAMIPLANASPSATESSGELRSVLYLRPSVGSSSSVGGSVTHAHEVIRALGERGVEVDPVTTDTQIAEAACSDPDPPCRWRVARTPRVLKALPASAGFGNDLALVRAALWSARCTDVIYQRHARFSIAGALVARLTGKPFFLEYNGSEEFVGHYWTPTTLRGQLAACERAALTAATRIFVVSDVDRENLLGRGVEPERIIVNPNGVSIERFAAASGTAIRRRLGLAETDFVIGFIGTFGPWHGAPLLARAFSMVAQKLPHAKLLLVGDGPQFDETQRQLVADGTKGQAILTGRVVPGEIPHYLDACDVLASPHVRLPEGVEFFGSPTKLFEYMAAGKAIIASDLGQIADVLDHGRTAWLVPPGDADALASAIHELAIAPELRRDLGVRARRQAEGHTWRQNAGRIIDTYQALTGEAG
jgi:glycosyltransferase involved in cell wall biosynthesis